MVKKGIRETRSKIEEQFRQLDRYEAEFLNENDFHAFIRELGDMERDGLLGGRHPMTKSKNVTHLDITGYFGKPIEDVLLMANKRNIVVRLLSRALRDGRQDKLNKQSLKKLHDAGVMVKFNERIHARIFNLYVKDENEIHPRCLLIGSFDFNLQGVSKERYDVGIRTRHPVLTEKVAKFFEEIWNDQFTKGL